MASPIALRRKIRSTKSTKQITKAMQMVAASKMRRAQDAVFKSRPFYNEAMQLLAELRSDTLELNHPLLVSRPVKKSVLVVIASDRGLCGAYNALVLRKAMEVLEANPTISYEIITVGRRAEEFFKRNGKTLFAVFNDFPEHPTLEHLQPILSLTIDRYSNSEIDQVQMVYTDFVNTLKQNQILKMVLPIELPPKKVSDHFLFEPSQSEVVGQVVPFLIQNQFYQALYNGLASEHSQRMMAMQNATDNAAEIIDHLNLLYNRIRQAKITQEIAEISAGAAAI
jgi:F-type H+-transporting ATPase subunit gamma